MASRPGSFFRLSTDPLHEGNLRALLAARTTDGC
jgi:hypothetical protein